MTVPVVYQHADGRCSWNIRPIPNSSDPLIYSIKDEGVTASFPEQRLPLRQPYSSISSYSIQVSRRRVTSSTKLSYRREKRFSLPSVQQPSSALLLLLLPLLVPKLLKLLLCEGLLAALLLKATTLVLVDGSVVIIEGIELAGTLVLVVV
jgi:hypothetical protein